jgi:hypothetical protein
MALKGHTRIELTNVETGEVEVHEDDNMVTNALSKLLGSYGVFCNNPLSSALSGDAPSTTIMRLTGGLMLFDTAIEENQEIINAPAGVSVVGCGSSISYSGANTMTGSYNETESGYTEDGGYKHVWDFTTSQANGNIACASLTTGAGGKITEGTYPFSSDYIYNSSITNEVLFKNGNVYKVLKFYRTNDSANYVLYADGINNRIYVPSTKEEVAYYRHNGTSTTNYENFKKSIFYKKSIDISFYRCGFTNFSIFDANSIDNEIGSDKDYLGNVTVEMPDGLKAIFTQEELDKSGTYWNVQALSDDDNIYFILRFKSTSSANIATGETIYIWEINAETFESKYYPITNFTDEAFTCITLSSGFAEIQDYMNINGDTIIFRGNTSKKIYLVSKSTNITYVLTTPDGEEYIIPNTTSIGMVSYSTNGKIAIGHYDNKTITGVIDTITRHITFKNADYSAFFGAQPGNSDEYRVLKVKGTHYLVHTGYSENSKSFISIYLDPTFLVTINNLETPVQKTSAQTMKVTYVLTQE